MKRRAETGERRPLRHRLEVVHRFRGFNLDGAQEPAAAIGRVEHEIRVPGQRPGGHRRRLLVARIDGHVEVSLVFRLKQANDPIVLKLLANRPHEDRAQQVLPDVFKPGEYSTRFHGNLDD